jgi:PAS domain S-box-containing protein
MVADARPALPSAAPAGTPKGPRLVAELTLVTVGVVGLEFLDYVTGPFMSFSLLYLLPIAFVAWRLGRVAGVAFAIVVVGCASFVDLAWPEVTGTSTYLWNAFSRAAVLVFGAVAITRIRRDRDLLGESNARLQDHLAAAETTFGLLADALADHAIVLFDAAGAATRWNAAAAVVTGMDAPTLEGATLDQIFPAADPEESTALTIPLGSHREAARWTLRADGARYWAEIDVYAVGSALGGRLLAVVRDATSRRRAEEELRRARDEAVAANRELEDFSYTVAHDLRSPLRSIDGFGTMLLEDCAEQLNERGRSYVARMRASSRRMGRLIDDLLEMSRLGRAPVRRGEVSVTALARDIGARLRDRHSARRVELVVEDGLSARADGQLVEVLLHNLLDNAWKFTSSRDVGHVEVGALRDATNGDAFFVRDDGVGFDMAYVHKLFHPFERLHTGDEFEGTGIGLATVRRIVERHGGRVWAESAVGRGTTVYFTLPPATSPDEAR